MAGVGSTTASLAGNTAGTDTARTRMKRTGFGLQLGKLGIHYSSEQVELAPQSVDALEKRSMQQRNADRMAQAKSFAEAMEVASVRATYGAGTISRDTQPAAVPQRRGYETYARASQKEAGFSMPEKLLLAVV